MYIGGNNVTYFDGFGVRYIAKEIKRFICNENVITNICRIQTYDSIISRYLYIAVLKMLKGKPNLFSFNR